jgi:hypothetical protein
MKNTKTNSLYGKKISKLTKQLGIAIEGLQRFLRLTNLIAYLPDLLFYHRIVIFEPRLLLVDPRLLEMLVHIQVLADLP